MTDIQKFDIIEPANPVLTVAPIKEETEMLGATDKITALYCRLSVEDLKEGKNGEKADESNSKSRIISQIPHSLWMTDTAVLTSIIAPISRGCLQKSTQGVWVRSSPKTCQDLDETLH